MIKDPQVIYFRSNHKTEKSLPKGEVLYQVVEED